jgi:predicted Zn-dependent protease with MMP-like domain
MDLKQNVDNLIKMIETKTNLLLILYRHNDGYMLEVISVKNDSSNEVLSDLVIKRYDDLLGMYKFLRGMYKTIKMLEFKDLELI